MTIAIWVVAIALISLAANAATGNRDHPGRLLIWLGLLWLICTAVLVPLRLVFHPQTWVLWVVAIALGLVMPTPKWVKRARSDT